MTRLSIIFALLATSQAIGQADQAKTRSSIQSALTFVDTAGAKIEAKASCVNCHHSALRSWSLREASEVGLDVDLAGLQKKTSDDVAKLIKIGKGYRGKQWDHSLSSFFVIAEGGNETFNMSGDSLDALAQMIVSGQQKDGSWKAANQFNGQRRPEKDAHEVQTMWSVLALSQLETRPGAAEAREKALSWLREKTPGTTIDSRVLRILIERTHGSKVKADELMADLLNSQHADGGWGWQPDDPSEAWPTGMVLYLFSQVGKGVSDSATDRAMAFLRQTQQEDGSWFVEGKLKKSPTMASYFGTVWAIIGMSRTLSATDAKSDS